MQRIIKRRNDCNSNEILLPFKILSLQTWVGYMSFFSWFLCFVTKPTQTHILTREELATSFRLSCKCDLHSKRIEKNPNILHHVLWKTREYCTRKRIRTLFSSILSCKEGNIKMKSLTRKRKKITNQTHSQFQSFFRWCFVSRVENTSSLQYALTSSFLVLSVPIVCSPCSIQLFSQTCLLFILTVDASPEAASFQFNFANVLQCNSFPFLTLVMCASRMITIQRNAKKGVFWSKRWS